MTSRWALICHPPPVSPIIALHRDSTDEPARSAVDRPYRSIIRLRPRGLVAALGQPARRLRARDEPAAAPGRRRDALFRCPSHLRAAVALPARLALPTLRRIAQ